MHKLFELASQALNCCSFDCKHELLLELEAQAAELQSVPVAIADTQLVAQAGRPLLPMLVHPSEVPRRRLGSVAGRIGLIHAIAHIEFNAVNLAIDAVYRFRSMPPAYYRDWIRVAREEAVHFKLLQERLQQLGSCYGQLPAHGGMWEMAVETNYDVVARMALVPRVLEARGLDVTPAMIAKLEKHGDTETVQIFERILTEEIEHVRIGNRWFQYACEQRGLEPLPTFSALLRKHGRIALRGPFNRDARLQAGFTEAELHELAELESEFKQDFLATPA